MPIQYVTGDATRPEGPGPKVICHSVNDIGKWGSGFVIALNRRWPRVERHYRAWHRAGDSPLVIALDSTPETIESYFQLGGVQFVQVETELWVANIVGQHRTIREGESTPVRYDALARGFETVAEFCLERRASAHMPRLGSGLGGGRWPTIAELVETALVARGIEVTVYDLPRGSSAV